MTKPVRRYLLRFARVGSLALFAMIGTMVMVRFAPGYFTDARELDTQYSSAVRAELAERQQREGSVLKMVRDQAGMWLHGDLGVSRHFEVPVRQLLRERAARTARLVCESVLYGWLLALACAVPVSLVRSHLIPTVVGVPVAVLLATPVAALATACLLADTGGPVLVLSAVIAARDFHFVSRLTRHAARAPHILYARAQGLSKGVLLWRHLLPALVPQILALAMMSLVLALSAAFPVEVIFDVPGLGQLAWTAAMNRDLPVLLAVTLVMAACVGAASFFVDARRTSELEQCA